MLDPAVRCRLRSFLWLLALLTTGCRGGPARSETLVSPCVGAAFWSVHDLLYAVRDQVLFPDFDAADEERIARIEETAGLSAEVALGLGDSSRLRSSFRGPGSYVPIDPSRTLEAGRLVLEEVRHAPAAERRTPSRFTHEWNKIRASIESLSDTRGTATQECLALAAELLAEVAPLRSRDHRGRRPRRAT
jgi:hypothetical protein